MLMKNLSLFLLVIILSSCSTSNDVVRSGFFQKRKYKKGYNLSFKKKENKIRKSKEEAILLATNSNYDKKAKAPAKKAVVAQVSEVKKAKQFNPIYAAANNSGFIAYQTVLSKSIGDTIVDDYVNTMSEEVGVGAQKIRIKRSKLYMLLSFVGMGLFIVGIATFPLLGVFAKFVFVPFLLGVAAFYASVFNLTKYTEAKFSAIKNPDGRDIKLLNRSKRLKNSSKLALLFFAISMALLFAIVLFVSTSGDLLVFLIILYFVIYIHFMVFLIMTFVNYLILYLSQRKEMKYDMSR